MTDPRLRIGITGASGFIGRHAVARFAARGAAVTAFQRVGATAPPAGVRLAPYRMPGPLEAAEFKGLDVLLHTALVEFGPTHRDADRVNRESVDTLIEMARAEGARIIFLSTLSAHDRAESHYGRGKLELERRFDLARDAVLRLGLVLGNGGLFGGMVNLIRSASVIPLPDGGRQPIQTLWMEDLLDVLERVATRAIAGRFDVATAEVYTMRRLYQAVMDALGLRRMLVPIPLGLIQAGVATLEALHVPFSINSENVLGLKHLRAFDNRADLAALGLAPLGLEASIQRLLEANAPLR